MPANILHTLFGKTVVKSVYAQLGFEVENICEQYRYIFSLGCQGPDIFYHSRMTRPVALEYGSLLHRRGFGNFAAALLKKTLPGKPENMTALSMYALGFMTHAFLDRFCHPYIVYKSIPTPDKKACFKQFFSYEKAHGFLERIIDVLMLELLQGISVSSWKQNDLAKICAEPPPELTELLEQTLREIYPERTDKDTQLAQRISNALQDCAEFYRLTDPEKTTLGNNKLDYRIPLAYIYPEKLPLHIDYLNLKHEKWYCPVCGVTVNIASFLEIYNNALETTKETLLQFTAPYIESGIFPSEKAALCIGNSGLSIQDENGNPCIPSKTEALPLEEALLQQKALRKTKN